MLVGRSRAAACRCARCHDNPTNTAATSAARHDGETSAGAARPAAMSTAASVPMSRPAGNSPSHRAIRRSARGRVGVGEAPRPSRPRAASVRTGSGVGCREVIASGVRHAAPHIQSRHGTRHVDRLCDIRPQDAIAPPRSGGAGRQPEHAADRAPRADLGRPRGHRALGTQPLNGVEPGAGTNGAAHLPTWLWRLRTRGGTRLDADAEKPSATCAHGGRTPARGNTLRRRTAAPDLTVAAPGVPTISGWTGLVALLTARQLVLRLPKL